MHGCYGNVVLLVVEGCNGKNNRVTLQSICFRILLITSWFKRHAHARPKLRAWLKFEHDMF